MIPKNYDIKDVEKRWQDRWEVEKTYRFDFKSNKPIYSIDNPPRYASGALHIGHATHYSHIDMIGRYKRLMGYNVFLPLCFDVNGMPIEVNVEKKYKISPKDMQRSEFTAICSEFANNNISDMINQFKILGCSFDPSIYYQTNAEYYRRITQITFLKMLEKGMVYKAMHPVNWCTRCVTALGDAEIEYQDRETMLNYIKFYLVDQDVEENEVIKFDHKGPYVTVATTRPELLPTCQIVAVHPEDKRYEAILGKTLKTPIFKRKVKVVADEKVEIEFGTGVVMICSIGDKDDLEFIYKYNLEFEKGIDEEGTMTDICGLYEGMSTIEARAKIVQDMQDRDLIIKRESIPQNVGSCWRCHTPVEFLVKEQWFVKVMPYKDLIHEAANKIKWYPSWMKVRLDQWVDSLSWDWVISRQRYFATPIPIWECKSCKKIVPAKIENCYIDPLETDPPMQFCPDCGGVLEGSSEVFDTWMDSSISALYNTFWYRDENTFKKMYPMSIRTQAHDIIRTWAFYSILRCTLLTDSEPWDSIFIDGHILAPDGRSMHASWGNAINPLEILDEHGADPFRYFATTRALGEDSAFSWKEITHASRLINKIYNIGKFLASSDSDGPIRLMDRWIASELAITIKNVEEAIENYQFSNVIREAEGFIWHIFADNYLEIIKYRLYDKSLPSGYIRKVFDDALKLMAPIMVHVTEEVHNHIMGETGSIHTSKWPSDYEVDERALKIGRFAKDLVSEIRRYKSDNGMPLNKEIEKITIYTQNDISEILEDVKGAMNIKEITISKDTPEFDEVISDITPNFALIGPRFGKDTNKVVELLKVPENAKRIMEEGKLDIEGLSLHKEYISKVERAYQQKGEKVELIESSEFIVKVC
ncbi:MAG TPA: valine--tRNA ligase [Candidatus Methanofastidiosa archaeon]|nr:valine--tRNA ligase [Candidatus Methanofastidiosa archaeon]